MKTKINLSPNRDFEEDPFQEILSEAATRAHRYLQAIGQRRVGVSPSALEGLGALGGPMPTKGEDPRSVLRLLDEFGSPATIASSGGRLFGGVIGGALPVTVAANWLAGAWDQNACLFDFSPVGAYLEDVVLRWLLNLFGLPSNCGGAFVTGTQMAGVTALAAARTAIFSGRLGCGERRLVCGATNNRDCG